jgi:exopolysaccharide biosynthesis polyprenyl glycosylphosphotransferase
MPNFKSLITLLGDIAILYVSLALTLFIRYGSDYFLISFRNHLKPFSLIFIIWLIVFYLANLYKNESLRIDLTMARSFVLTVSINVVVSIILFYLFVPFFKLTPKTNLGIFAVVFGLLALGWRFILAKIFISGGLRNRLLIIGDSSIINETVRYLKNNSQLGYDIISQIKEHAGSKSEQEMKQAIASDKISGVVIQPHFKKDPEIAKFIYQLLPYEIAVVDFITFYETIFQKLPLEELEESWFIEKITTRRRLYDAAKRFLDVALSFVLIIILLPLTLLIAALIKITSAGPILYAQERIGKGHRPFILYKFRTMKANHQGPLWTTEGDKRLTFVGKILRYAHLDEIPQLLNILKGDVSFIGPRPERKELVELYSRLPYYEIRHIIKPGLTGWAQVNYKASASVEEAEEKLRYDIYYIKNRSLILDLLILIKTVRYFFVKHET